MMTYQKLQEKIKNRETKKLANNTYIVREGDSLAVRLHSTNILSFSPDNTITINSGGWKTVTTKSRINEYLGNPSISQDRGLWYWWTSGNQSTWKEQRIPFTDGDQIVDGKLKTQATPSQDKKQSKLRKQIDTYAKLCASKIPLEKPPGGDCLYCVGLLTGTPKIGLLNSDEQINYDYEPTDHLLCHMKEGYVVSSLVWKALKEDHTAPVIWWGSFKDEAVKNPDHFKDFAMRGVRRAVNKYMRKRLGLPL